MRYFQRYMYISVALLTIANGGMKASADVLRLDKYFQVIGIIAESNAIKKRVGIAVLKDIRQGGKSLVVREGSAIPGYPHLKVAKVARKKITVSDGNSDQVLSYQSFQTSQVVGFASAKPIEPPSKTEPYARGTDGADDEFGDVPPMNDEDLVDEWSEPFDDFPEDRPPPYNRETGSEKTNQRYTKVDKASRAWIPPPENPKSKKRRFGALEKNGEFDRGMDDPIDAVPHPDDF